MRQSGFEGSYVANKKEGRGTFSWPDGACYTGEFLNNSIHGGGDYRRGGGGGGPRDMKET